MADAKYDAPDADNQVMMKGRRKGKKAKHQAKAKAPKYVPP